MNDANGTNGAQVGDFLVCHGTGPLDRLIQFGTRSRWNHIALVAEPDGTLIEAIGRGIVRSPATKYDGADHYHVAVALSDEDRAEVEHYAHVLLDRKARYGWLTILLIVLRILTGSRLVLWLDGTEICSQFVGAALEHGGMVWDRDPSQLSPADVLTEATNHPAMAVAVRASSG